MSVNTQTAPETIVENVAVTPEASVTPEAAAPETPVTPETPTEPEPKVETPEERRMAAKFAALSRREKELVEREKTLKTQYEERVAAWEQAQAKAKSNPIQYLESVGLSLDDLAAFILNDNKPTPDLQFKELEDKISSLEKQREAERQAELERQQKLQEEYFQETVNRYKTSVRQYLHDKTDQFEYAAASEQTEDLVWEVTQEYFNRTQQVLPMEDALKAVEAHFEEEAEKELEQLMKLPKWQQKVMARIGTVKQDATPQESSDAHKSSVTLTNKATVTPTPSRDRVELSAETFYQDLEESKNRAAAFLAKELAKVSR